MAQMDQTIQRLIKPEYETLIFQFRGFKVMIDSDLAMLYDVSTKRLKEQIKRNVGRFPEDFMFELTSKERDELVANCDRLSIMKHSSINPMVFTEQGVAMLSFHCADLPIYPYIFLLSVEMNRAL